jgi:hypothetical protein
VLNLGNVWLAAALLLNSEELDWFIIMVVLHGVGYG